jgi:hypothetical protein
MYCGIELMVFPYFIDGLAANILIGAGLSIAPFVLKKL